MVMKASHSFNLLDARGAISVTERAAYIGRVRALAREVAQAYYDSRERLGFPMLKPNDSLSPIPLPQEGADGGSPLRGAEALAAQPGSKGSAQ
jgi:hypothetical protein